MHHAHSRIHRRHFIASTLALSIGTTLHATETPHILVLGDSLSAEYGLTRGEGWVALLENKLRTAKINASVTNASISGETTSGGRSRLPLLLQKHRPSIVIIELGGNDALRGLPLSGTLENLRAMTRTAQASGAKVLIMGMQMPPNYGQKYAQDFEQLFSQVAQQYQTALVPMFLKNVADAHNPTALFQADRIHPTAQAQPLMLANVWPTLRPLLPQTKP